MVTGPPFRIALKELHYKNNFDSFETILIVNEVKNTQNSAYI